MMRTLVNGLLGLLLVLPAALSWAESEEERFQTVFAAAESARKEAARLGHEWRDTRKMLKQAKAAAEKSDFATGIELAETARFHSEQAVEQAQQQAKIWQDAVPK